MEEPHEADGCSWREVTASAGLSKGRGNSSAFGRGLPAVIIDGSGTARFAASAAAAASAARAADQTAAAAAAAFFCCCGRGGLGGGEGRVLVEQLARARTAVVAR